MLFKHFGSNFTAIPRCLSVLILSVPDWCNPYTLQFTWCLLIDFNFSSLVNYAEIRSSVSDKESLTSANLQNLILVKADTYMRSEIWFQNVLHKSSSRCSNRLERH